VAFSAPETGETPDYTAILPYLYRVMDDLMSSGDLDLVNVNFPRKPSGVRWTRQSVRHYDVRAPTARDPPGREIFRVARGPLGARGEGPDRWAADTGLVPLTPLRLDLTDHERLDQPLGSSPRRQATG